MGQCNHKSPHKREAGGSEVQKGDMTTEAEVGVMYFEVGKNSHEPRNMGGF